MMADVISALAVSGTIVQFLDLGLKLVGNGIEEASRSQRVFKLLDDIKTLYVELERIQIDPTIDEDDEEPARALHRLILECESMAKQFIAA
jgi:hypothetical protein